MATQRSKFSFSVLLLCKQKIMQRPSCFTFTHSRRHSSNRQHLESPSFQRLLYFCFQKEILSKNIPIVPSLTPFTHSKEISFTPDIVFKALR